jgi:arginase family enzyme
VFEHLPHDIPYYLSFDMDVLDPSVALETGVPVPGGLSFHQAVLLLDHASRSLSLIGADIVDWRAHSSLVTRRRKPPPASPPP